MRWKDQKFYTLSLTLMLLTCQFGNDYCHAQTFDPGSAVLLDYIPPTGTFYSLSGFPPLPFDPNTNLSLYFTGVSNVYFCDDTGNGRFAMALPSPGAGGWTNGGTSGYPGSNSYNIQTFVYSTNLWQYTNFWLTITATNNLTNDQNALVGVENTIPGYIYQIQTNPALTVSNWVPWTNLLAITTNTPAPPIYLGTNNLFFRGQIVLPSSSYITNGLVAWWKLNDTSGTNAADSSGYGNPLSLSNSPYWGPGSLILNGTNQFGDAGTNAAEINYYNITVCAWINQSSNAYKGIVDKSWNDPMINAYGGWGFWINETGHLMFHANTTCTNDGLLIVGAGEWSFVTVVWQPYYSGGQRADFYINGVHTGSSGNNLMLNVPTDGLADLLVGNLQNNLSNGLYAFNGSIRDVGVYNRALSPEEVQSNYLATTYFTNVPVPNLLDYKMTEYAPSNATSPSLTLFDSSGHGGTTGSYYNDSHTWVTNQAGISNSALHFSGDIGYINTSNSSLFNFTNNSFTLNLWLQPQNGNGYVMGNNSYQSNGWFLSVNNGYTVYFGSENPGVESIIYTQNDVYGWPSIYNMVTVTRSGSSTPLIYINGMAVPTGGTFASPAPSTSPLIFATGTNGFGNYVLDGNIWQPQIWSRDLSPGEILILYTNQLAGNPWP